MIAAATLGVMIGVAITPDPVDATTTPKPGRTRAQPANPHNPPPEIPAGFSGTPSPLRRDPCGGFISVLADPDTSRECWYPPPPNPCDGVDSVELVPYRWKHGAHAGEVRYELLLDERGLNARAAIYFDYEPCASRWRLLQPGTRMFLVRDYDRLSHPDDPFSPDTRGHYEGWLYPNGTDPATGYPQFLIQGGAPPDWPNRVAGCAGIDILPGSVRLVLASGHLSGPHRRVAGEIVSERDDWRIVVSFGPLPEGPYGDPYRCNADPEGSGVAP